MRVFLIVLGVLLFLVGGACTVGGAVALSLVGSDGWVQSGTDEVDVRGAALVTGAEDIEDEAAGDDFPGDVRIRIRAQMDDGSPVFIGVARASDATSYLQGAPLDVVDDLELDPTEIETEFVPGTVTLEPPTEQDFWLDSVSGGGQQELDWEVESGQFRFVVTPVEPQESFLVNVSAGVKLPFIRVAAFIVLGFGILLLIAGVLLVIFGARRTDRPHPVLTEPPTPSASGVTTADQPAAPPPPADREDAPAPSDRPPPAP